MKLDKSSKTLLMVFVVLVVVSIFATYYRALVTKNFETYYDDYGESVPAE